MLTQDYLHSILSYNQDTGIFTWKIAKQRIKIGQVAGHVHHTQYVRIIIDQKSYAAHRLAWLYVYGYIPKNNIDHIDGNPSNNKISNLREATFSQNNHNAKLRKDNKSGIKGVYFDNTCKRYIAKIGLNNKPILLGYFKNIEEAEKAIKEAREKYHQQFKRDN